MNVKFSAKNIFRPGAVPAFFEFLLPPGSRTRLLTAVRAPIVGVMGPSAPAEPKETGIGVVTSVLSSEYKEVRIWTLDFRRPGPARNSRKLIYGRPDGHIY